MRRAKCKNMPTASPDGHGIARVTILRPSSAGDGRSFVSFQAEICKVHRAIFPLPVALLSNERQAQDVCPQHASPIAGFTRFEPSEWRGSCGPRSEHSLSLCDERVRGGLEDLAAGKAMSFAKAPHICSHVDQQFTLQYWSVLPRRPHERPSLHRPPDARDRILIKSHMRCFKFHVRCLESHMRCLTAQDGKRSRKTVAAALIPQ
jgi:hypothetical protein